MGFGGYNFGALTTVRGIAFRLLEKSSPAQIAETGIKVARVVEEFKDKHPEILRTKPSRGLLDMGPIPLNNFELAFQLCNSDDPAMVRVIKDAKDVDVLIAYLAVVTSGADLPDDTLLESALPFALASLTEESDVAKLWNQELQKDVVRLWPLARTGQNHGVAQASRRMGKTKLSESQKRQIIREHEAAVVKYGTIKSLARKFNVSDDTIKRVLDSKVTQKETKQD